MTVGCGIGVSASGSIEAAIQRVEASLTPPTKLQAEDWLAMLQVACAAGRRSEANSMLTLALYTGALVKFPADVSRKACENLALRNRDETNWFPTLGELVGECERMAGPRQTLLAAMKNHAEPSPLEAKRERIRQLLFEAVELDRATFLYKHSEPEKYAEAQAKIGEWRAEADRLRRGAA